MERKNEILLLIDGTINLILGVFLLLFLLGINELLGVPGSEMSFYPSILGGVIFGIGIALLIERYGFKNKIRGLGLGGAIVINLCGAFNIPLRGYVILWSIAIIVLLVGIGEIITKSWHY